MRAGFRADVALCNHNVAKSAQKSTIQGLEASLRQLHRQLIRHENSGNSFRPVTLPQRLAGDSWLWIPRFAFVSLSCQSAGPVDRTMALNVMVWAACDPALNLQHALRFRIHDTDGRLANPELVYFSDSTKVLIRSASWRKPLGCVCQGCSGTQPAGPSDQNDDPLDVSRTALHSLAFFRSLSAERRRFRWVVRDSEPQPTGGVSPPQTVIPSNSAAGAPVRVAQAQKPS